MKTTLESFERKGDLIPPPAGMTGPGAYYTCLFDTRELKNFPFDFALYFSTDHDPGPGGIWLYGCNGTPTQAENWISYDEAVKQGKFDHLPHKPQKNPIFIDRVQSDGHTETPHAQIIDGKVYLTYHKDRLSPNQSTLLATSDDGVNFHRIHGEENSIILTYNVETDPGNGHTGYFRWGPNPFKEIDAQFIGYSLHGGGKDFFSALWSSNDAIEWNRREIMPPVLGRGLDKEDRIIGWHDIDPASIRQIGKNEYAAICGVSTIAWGDQARITELYEIYIEGDGVTLTRQSREILGVGAENSTDSEELGSPTSIVIGDTFHLLYVGACEQGTRNTVMAATAKRV